MKFARNIFIFFMFFWTEFAIFQMFVQVVVLVSILFLRIFFHLWVDCFHVFILEWMYLFFILHTISCFSICCFAWGFLLLNLFHIFSWDQHRMATFYSVLLVASWKIYFTWTRKLNSFINIFQEITFFCSIFRSRLPIVINFHCLFQGISWYFLFFALNRIKKVT